MKNLIILILLFNSMLSYGSQCTSQNVEFAEISFRQDSINPMKIHLVCKVKAQMDCDFGSDRAVIYWGDSPNSYGIPLVDTQSLAIGFNSRAVLKTYEGDYTYDSTYADSTVLIGLELSGIYPFNTLNVSIDPRGVSLSPITAINFAYLKNHIGITPPAFDSFTLPFDSIYHILDFRPGFTYDSSYTLKAEMIWPICYYPDLAGDIYAVGGYPPVPANHVDFDTTNGHFVWNAPLGNGAFMICYRMSLYKQDTFVCYMTRDFMVDVLGTQHVGITEVSSTQSAIRCYPSPTSGTFTIDMSAYDPSERQVYIYDQLGQVVYQATTGQAQLLVSASLASGLYTVAVTQGTRRDYVRVVIE